MVNKGQGGCGGAPYLYDEASSSIETCATKCLADENCIKVQRGNGRCYYSGANSGVQPNEPSGSAGWECRFKE